jgi:exoribonuclease R
MWQIPAEELAKRRDLREERIFSIDPPTAKSVAHHWLRKARVAEPNDF